MSSDYAASVTVMSEEFLVQRQLSFGELGTPRAVAARGRADSSKLS